MATTALVVATFVAGPTATAGATGTAPDDQDVLALVNLARAQAWLPPVSSDAGLDAATANHVQWMLRNSTIGHAQCTPPLEVVCVPLFGTVGGTLEGHRTAANSLVTGSSQARTPGDAFRNWITGPFHAGQILSPRLEAIGFADGADGEGFYKWAAALDVLSAFNTAAEIDADYPLTYPAHTATTAITTYPGGESPDPLAPCGLTAPTGAPIYVQLGDHFAQNPPAPPALVSAALFVVDPENPFEQTQIEACAYDGTENASGYTNPDPSHQLVGRSILARRGMIVVIPAQPLQPGTRYRYEVRAQGRPPVTATFDVAPTGESGVAPLEAPFTDIGTRSTFVDAIRWLVSSGITSGCVSATFCPSAPVTRAQMAAFLYRAAGSPPFTPPPVSQFADVPATNIFYPQIAWLATSGITSGCGGDRFCPGGTVNRSQMASFLYRMAQSPAHQPPAASPFDDVPVADLFYSPVTWLATSGVTSGCSATRFCPTAQVTRDQMASFLYRFNYFVAPIGTPAT